MVVVTTHEASVQEATRQESMRRFRVDPCLFMDTLITLRPSEGKFRLRDYQRESVETMHNNRRVIVLKARQLGWTTIASLYALWVAMFRPDSVVIIFSRTQKYAIKNLAIAVKAYKNLPAWMRAEVKLEGRGAKTEIRFSNGSVIYAEASKDNAARGDAADLIIVDEFAFFEDPEGAWASIEPAAEERGRVVMFSTANGRGNMFHTMYVGAKAGENEFVSKFLPWNVHPGRDQAWFENKCRNEVEWIRQQEYPSDDEECFLRSGNLALAVHRIDESTIREYDTYAIIGSQPGLGKPMPSVDDDALLRVYKKPYFDFDKNRYHTYVMGVDVALGTENGDYQAIQVIDVETLEVVAVYESRVAAEDLASVVVAIAKWYNNPLIAIEKNNHGATVISDVWAFGYKKLFTPNPMAKMRYGEKAHKKYGWSTTQATKPKMVDDLSKELGTLTIYDQRTVTQATSFMRKVTPGGTVKFEGKPHDDLIDALSIAVQMVPHASIPAVPVEQDEPGGLRYRDLIGDRSRLEGRGSGSSWGERRSRAGSRRYG